MYRMDACDDAGTHAPFSSLRADTTMARIRLQQTGSPGCKRWQCVGAAAGRCGICRQTIDLHAKRPSGMRDGGTVGRRRRAGWTQIAIDCIQ